MLAFTIQCRGRKFYRPISFSHSFSQTFFSSSTWHWLVVMSNQGSFLLSPLPSKADCWFPRGLHYPPLMIRSGQSDPISDLLVLLASFISCHLHCLVFIVFSLLHTPSVESHLIITNAKTNKPTRKNTNTNTSNKWNVQIFWGCLIIGWAFYIYLTTMKQKQLFVNVLTI